MLFPHENCQGWEYSTHPNRALVTSRCRKIAKALRNRPTRFKDLGYKTEIGHGYIFKDIAPLACPYFAGNYRGSDFPCLKEYLVGVPMDSRIGTEPQKVRQKMREFDLQLEHVIKALQKQFMLHHATNPEILLTKLVTILSLFLQKFLTIHPYANGNGHMARLMVAVLLGRFGYWPERWPLDESPNYYQALTDHRDGKAQPLHDFILKAIVG